MSEANTRFGAVSKITNPNWEGYKNIPLNNNRGIKTATNYNTTSDLLQIALESSDTISGLSKEIKYNSMLKEVSTDLTGLLKIDRLGQSFIMQDVINEPTIRPYVVQEDFIFDTLRFDYSKFTINKILYSAFKYDLTDTRIKNDIAFAQRINRWIRSIEIKFRNAVDLEYISSLFHLTPVANRGAHAGFLHNDINLGTAKNPVRLGIDAANLFDVINRMYEAMKEGSFNGSTPVFQNVTTRDPNIVKPSVYIPTSLYNAMNVDPILLNAGRSGLSKSSAIDYNIVNTVIANQPYEIFSTPSAHCVDVHPKTGEKVYLITMASKTATAFAYKDYYAFDNRMIPNNLGVFNFRSVMYDIVPVYLNEIASAYVIAHKNDFRLY